MGRALLTALSLIRRGKNDVRFKVGAEVGSGLAAGDGERAQSYYVMDYCMFVRLPNIQLENSSDHGIAGWKRAINACLRAYHLQGFISTTKLQQRVFHFHPPAPPLAHDSKRRSINSSFIVQSLENLPQTNRTESIRAPQNPATPQKDVYTGDALALTCRSSASSTSRLSTTAPDSEHLALSWSSWQSWSISMVPSW